MFPLIKPGAHQPDWFGNVHTLLDRRGYPVLRDPGRYRARHAAETAPRYWFTPLLAVLAWVAGERV